VPDSRPNVLVLMCDQFRADALSCLGHPLARTPNLDRLAARAVRFTNAFTQSPVCAPTRHSLNTGLYPHAHGVVSNSARPRGELFTLAHALSPLGYRCFQLGHMHWTDPDRPTGYEPNASTPDLWRQSQPQEVLARRQWECQDITRRTTAGPNPFGAERFWGHHVAANAVRLIESAAGQNRPFLCWASFTEPHPPFYPPRDFYERIDPSRIVLPAQPPADAPPPHERILQMRRQWQHLTAVELKQILAGYYGLVALADSFCGTVLDALDRLGVRDRTLVVFTSDHGDQMGEHGLFLKFVMREASVRVPLLIDAPGRGAGVRDELVEHVDVFPAICELLGAEIPSHVQGRSLAGLVDGTAAPADWRDAVFSREADKRMVRTRRWKLNTYGGEAGELFDLEADPDEFVNRLGDPQCAEVVRTLMDRLRRWETA